MSDDAALLLLLTATWMQIQTTTHQWCVCMPILVSLTVDRGVTHSSNINVLVTLVSLCLPRVINNSAAGGINLNFHADVHP